MAKNIRKACNKRNLYFTIRNEVRKEVSRILDSDGGSKNHPQVTEETACKPIPPKKDILDVKDPFPKPVVSDYIYEEETRDLPKGDFDTVVNIAMGAMKQMFPDAFPHPRIV